MSTLYELTSDYQMLLDMATDPDIDPQAILDTMDSLQGDIEDKIEGYGKVIAEMQAQVDAKVKERDRLNDRIASEQNNIRAMKDRIKAAMILTGKTKIKKDLFTFSVRNNGGKTPIIYNVQPEELPDAFRQTITTYKADNEAIRTYLDGGGESEFFKYGERGNSLIIK